MSGARWALMHELRGDIEPDLESILGRMSPCDLVLIEGYKRESHKKIEVRRLEAKSREPLAPSDPNIVAIAADHPQGETGLPVFTLDDLAAIADFVETTPAFARDSIISRCTKFVQSCFAIAFSAKTVGVSPNASAYTAPQRPAQGTGRSTTERKKMRISKRFFMAASVGGRIALTLGAAQAQEFSRSARKARIRPSTT